MYWFWGFIDIYFGREGMSVFNLFRFLVYFRCIDIYGVMGFMVKKIVFDILFE